MIILAGINYLPVFMPCKRAPTSYRSRAHVILAGKKNIGFIFLFISCKRAVYPFTSRDITLVAEINKHAAHTRFRQGPREIVLIIYTCGELIHEMHVARQGIAHLCTSSSQNDKSVPNFRHVYFNLRGIIK